MNINDIPVKQDTNPMSNPTTQVSAEEFNCIVETVKETISMVTPLTKSNGSVVLEVERTLTDDDGHPQYLEFPIPKATVGNDGLMSKEDKIKLDNLSENGGGNSGGNNSSFSADEVRHLVNNKEYKVYAPVGETANMNIYAPTAAGSVGNILISSGGGKAPTWGYPTDIKAGDADHADFADNATKASQDSAGRHIVDTYLTKDELGDIGTNASEALQKANKASQDVANQQATIDSIEEQLANIGDVGAASAAKDVIFTAGTTGLTQTNVQGAISELAGKVTSEVARAIEAENTINVSLGDRIDSTNGRITQEANKVSTLQGQIQNAVTSVAIAEDEDISAEAISLTIKTVADTKGSWVTFPSATSKKAGLMSAADKENLGSLKANAVTGIGVDDYSDEDNLILKLYRSTNEADEVNIPAATTSSIGFMSKEDKAKLDSLSTAENYPLVSQTINGESYNIATNESKSLSIYAPAKAGSEGNVILADKNGIPYWADQADLHAGNADMANYAKTAGTASNATDATNATTAEKAIKDGSGNVITETYVSKASAIYSTSTSKGISVHLSGTHANPSIEVEVSAGSVEAGVDKFVTGSAVFSYAASTSAMTGATSSAAGKKGLVPAPSAGSQAKYLRGDGTWQNITAPEGTMVWGGILNTAAYAKDYSVGTILKVTTNESLSILEGTSLVNKSVTEGTKLIVSYESYMSGSSSTSGKVFIEF